MNIRIEYSCPSCGLTRVSCVVPVRVDGEGVANWMRQTVTLAGDDHARRSPACDTRQLRDLMIPVTGTTRIGGAVIQ